MDSGRIYIQALLHIRWFLDALEEWLESRSDASPIDPLQLRTVSRLRLATQDQVALGIEALCEMGIFIPGHPLRFSQREFLETSGYRRGLRDMLESISVQEQSVQLCATLPIGLADLVENALREDVLDLRAALFDLIASAHVRIVIASPFWDRTTSREIAELLRKRLSSGVRVDILGRLDKGSENEYLTFAKSFVSFPEIHFYNWYKANEEDFFKVQTFHFKTIIIDNGARAYLGSANMTLGGLRSRMELGTILKGSTATTLAHILDMVFSIAKQISKNSIVLHNSNPEVY